jgi:hypothetical protein
VTIETIIFAKLGPLVENRCFPDTFVQPNGSLPEWPAIRFTVITGRVDTDILGDGDENTDTPLVQLDIVTETAKARSELRQEVRAAMATLNPPATLEGSPDQSYDSETKTYRCRADYSIHGSTGQGLNSPP